MLKGKSDDTLEAHPSRYRHEGGPLAGRADRRSRELFYRGQKFSQYVREVRAPEIAAVIDRELSHHQQIGSIERRRQRASECVDIQIAAN